MKSLSKSLNESMFETDLKKRGFTKSDDIESLKVSYNRVNDLRYFYDNEFWGLHISGVNLNYERFDWEDFKLTYKFILRDLKVLYLAHCTFEIFKINSGEMPSLEFLHIFGNGVLKSVKIYNAFNLIELNTSFSPNLDTLSLLGNSQNLEKINVSFCRLNKIEFAFTLNKLSYFNFSNNQFQNVDFLKNILKSPLDYVFGQNNPIQQDELRGIFEDKENIDVRAKLVKFYKGTLIPVNRNKLILLGNTKAGKTSLCDILRGADTANGESTHGVNIFYYTLPKQIDENEEIVYQVYDFGGQDFYHNTHLAFFGEKAKYLMVAGNGQPDGFGQIKANKSDRMDNIFPMSYWLNSASVNLPDFPLFNLTKEQQFEQCNIKLALLHNNKKNDLPTYLNHKDLVEQYAVSEFFESELRTENGKKLSSDDSKAIKNKIDDWLIRNNSPQVLTKKNLLWEKYFQAKIELVVVSKKAFKSNHTIDLENKEEPLHEDDFDFLSYAFIIHKCGNANSNAILQENVIVNLDKFTKWIYVILNIKNLLGKGVFNKKQAIKWLNEAKLTEASKHIEFMIEFMLFQKMIFRVENTDNFIVPQYLPEPQYPSDKLLLKLFDKPFVKYEFTGFYHTQILTSIIAEFFDFIVKETVDKTYRHLMWKNKVILYLNKVTLKKDILEDEDPKDFLLIEFKLENQKPTLSLSELKQNVLRNSLESLKSVMDFIEKKLIKIKHDKQLKTPNSTYISADLLNENNVDAKGSTDLIYDPNNKYFYRKGDFPLFIDPTKYPMKKIFISYSKSDVKYRDEFKKHFYPLKRQSKIDTFDDSDLGFGEWNPQILKKIEECDIFVCLVSIDFLNTDYIINTEIPHAIKHEKTIIPIKIRECDWSDFLLEQVNEKGEKELNLKLGAYNASLKAKTISLFSEKDNYFDKRINTIEERDAVWTELVNQFKKKINL